MPLVKKFSDDVLAFHNAMGLPVADGMGSAEVRALRETLITEETWETVEKGFKARNWEQVIDGLCDTMYVTVGAAISFGVGIYKFVPMIPDVSLIDNHPPFYRGNDSCRLLLAAKRVACHAINRGDRDEAIAGLSGLVSTIGYVASYYEIPLDRFWEEVQRANMAKVGGPIRADGKRLKPPGWRGPDHMPLIRRYWPEQAARLDSAVTSTT